MEHEINTCDEAVAGEAITVKAMIGETTIDKPTSGNPAINEATAAKLATKKRRRGRKLHFSHRKGKRKVAKAKEEVTTEMSGTPESEAFSTPTLSDREGKDRRASVNEHHPMPAGNTGGSADLAQVADTNSCDAVADGVQMMPTPEQWEVAHILCSLRHAGDGQIKQERIGPHKGHFFVMRKQAEDKEIEKIDLGRAEADGA